MAFQALTLIQHCNRPKDFWLRYNTFPQIKFGSNMGSNNLTWTSQNQTGVNKLQITNHKSQTNYKLQCPNDQARLGFIELSSMIITSLFGILCLFIGICLLFGLRLVKASLCLGENLFFGAYQTSCKTL